MKKLISLIAVTILSLGCLLAQKTVTGTVTDKNGDGLSGVAVVAYGTTVGTYTDEDGKYTIDVPAGVDKLIYKFVGMGTQEVAIGTGPMNIAMREEDVYTDEVVVTALGISRDKKSLGYATQEVAGEEVMRVKDANFMNSLSGKLAGVDIKRGSGIGASTNVIVRGYTSIGNNNQALFVVDGIPIDNAIRNTENMQTGRGGYDFGNAAMDINPEDIESINVLRGAAATALYGHRAANGVVMIVTKKGTKGKGIGVTVSTGLTMGTIDKSTFVRSQREYGGGYSAIQGWYADGGLELFDFGDGAGPELITPTYEDASYGQKFDPSIQVYNWRSLYPELSTYKQKFPFEAGENDATTFYETSKLWNTNVSIDGGSEKTNFRLSYTNFNQTGIIPNSQIKKNTVSLAAGHDVTEKFNVSTVINYVAQEGRSRYGTGYDNRNPNQSFRQWYSVETDMAEQLAAYEQTGKNISWNPYGALDPGRATVPHYFDNYYFNAYENVPTDERNRIFGNVVATYEITDWLNVMGRVTRDQYSETREERIAIGSVDVSKYDLRKYNWAENNFDLFLNANKAFGDDGFFTVDAMLGTNIQRNEYTQVANFTNGGLVVPNVYSLSNSKDPIQSLQQNERVGVDSYFGRASFGIANMVYLEFSDRYSTFSSLPLTDNSEHYPAASASFVFSKLLGENDILNFGKARVNYATVANGAPPLSLVNTYGLGTAFNGVPIASAPGTKKNPDLSPERTRSYEAGLEMNMFKNRVGIDFSVYQSNTFNQNISVDVSQATGYVARFIKVGEVQNKGVELSLNITPVKSKDFKWDIRFNWARNVNEVLELAEGQDNLQLNSVQGGVTLNATVGEPFGSIWGTNYVYHTDGESPIVYDHWNSGVRYRKTGAPEAIGNINPDWRGGVQNIISFKGIALNFLIDVQKGGDFFSLDTWYGYATGVYDLHAGTNKNGVEHRALPSDGGGIFLDDGAVKQTGNDPETGAPISDGTVNSDAFYVSDVYNSLGYVYAPNALHVYDASYVKLREVALSYSLPKDLVANSPLQNVTLSFIGRNLWIIHKNTPYSDPEAGLSAGNNLGNQSGAYPNVKEYGLNLSVKF